MVTLLVNAALLVAFLASLALELSPRLSRHPGRRFGTPEWRKENLFLWDTMRVSDAAKAQANARDAALSESAWNARSGRDLSAWLEPAPGEKLDRTPLYQWLKRLHPDPERDGEISRSDLQQRFPLQECEKLDRAIREAPLENNEDREMLGTFVMQSAFLLALHGQETPAVERAAGELGGVSKPRLVGHVNTFKSRFFDRIPR